MIPLLELYLVVKDAAVYHARALAAGARKLSPLTLRDWGHLAAYSLDPDGHVLAIAFLPADRRQNRQEQLREDNFGD